jgi:hypothetical protein
LREDPSALSRPTRRYHLPSAFRRSPVRIEPAAARELVARGALLLDVRRHDADGYLEGARRIAPDEIPEQLAAMSRALPVVLACT